MQKHHWYLLAGAAGLAIGLFYVGTSSVYSQNATLNSIYTAGTNA